MCYCSAIGCTVNWYNYHFAPGNYKITTLTPRAPPSINIFSPTNNAILQENTYTPQTRSLCVRCTVRDALDLSARQGDSIKCKCNAQKRSSHMRTCVLRHVLTTLDPVRSSCRMREQLGFRFICRKRNCAPSNQMRDPSESWQILRPRRNPTRIANALRAFIVIAHCLGICAMMLIFYIVRVVSLRGRVCVSEVVVSAF